MNSTTAFDNFLQTLADNFWPPFIFALVVGLPSVILYSIEFGVLIHYRSKDFVHTFYDICAIRAITAILGYIASYLNARLPKIGFSALIGFYNWLPSFAVNIIYFFHFFPFHLENFATAFLLLNRLTAIAYPFDYEKFWRKFFPLVLIAIVCLPLPFTAHIFTLDIYVRYGQDSQNVTFTLDYRDKEHKPINATLGAYNAVIFTCICFVLNVACLVAYKCTKQGIVLEQHSSSYQSMAIESRLTKYTVLTFLGQLLMAIYYVLIHIAVRLSVDQHWDQPFDAVYNQYPWINDVGTIVAPSWIFLWACEPLRRRIFRMFRKNAVGQSVSTNGWIQ